MRRRNWVVGSLCAIAILTIAAVVCKQTTVQEETKADEVEEIVEVVEPVEEPETVEVTESAEETETVEVVEPVEEPEIVEVVEPAEEPEIIEVVEPVEETEVVEVVEPAEEPEVIETAAPVEEAEVVEPAAPVEETKATEEKEWWDQGDPEYSKDVINPTSPNFDPYHKPGYIYLPGIGYIVDEQGGSEGKDAGWTIEEALKDPTRVG